MIFRQCTNGWFRRFSSNDSGATAIEYGIVSAVIGMVLVVVAGSLGVGLTDTFQSVGNKLEAAANPDQAGDKVEKTMTIENLLLQKPRNSN